MPEIATTTARSPEVLTQIDEVTTNLTYLGVAKLGTADADAAWQIRRINKNGGVTTIQYADGNRRFDNVWDDRASLNYIN